jgi:hypothetical protein
MGREVVVAITDGRLDDSAELVKTRQTRSATEKGNHGVGYGLRLFLGPADDIISTV